jgi:hypothetical protein
MRGSKAVVGVFPYIDDALRATLEVKALELDFKVYSPFPVAEIVEVSAPEQSPIKLIAAGGFAAGFLVGLGITLWSVWDLPLRVSAKEVVAWPAFLVVAFECALLVGALATCGAMLYYCGLPRFLRKVGYDAGFSEDKFGVVVGCEKEQVHQVSNIFKQAGAEEVQLRDGF